MEVPQVVLAKERECTGGLDLGHREGIIVQLRPLDDPHPGQASDPWALPLVTGTEQDGH